MNEDWYKKTPEELKYSGFENDAYAESSDQFEGALKYANNAHDIDVTRYISESDAIVQFSTRVLITSNVESRHDVKQVTYRKGELRIGDLYDYQGDTYLMSRWENKDISTYDNIESVICNTSLKVDITTRTPDGTDMYGKIKYIDTTVEENNPCYYNNKSDVYDDGELINLPKYNNEVWVQFREYYEVDLKVAVYDTPYVITEVDLTYTKIDGSGNRYGAVRLALDIKK